MISLEKNVVRIVVARRSRQKLDQRYARSANIHGRVDQEKEKLGKIRFVSSF